ncbi:TadE/TadG family type IV pilus assembly protein [Aeromicrobium sp.]|uniref:TadE/TadG family type IV pilus assembly protein n=1 Tax=Aeromicrobium sp. TaxID=1871063 RepID=UPI003C44B9CA
MRCPPSAAEHERGSAVVDFVLVMVVLVPLVLGIAQVGLVLHVRNTLTAAASDGARAAAPLDATTGDGVERARDLIRGGLADRYAEDVSATITSRGGVPVTEVVVHARVPALGILGPTIEVTTKGHAVLEVAP